MVVKVEKLRRRKEGAIERPGPAVIRKDGLRRKVRVGSLLVD